MLNINRVDHHASHTHCWRVTIQRQTQIYREEFSDGQYGAVRKRSPPSKPIGMACCSLILPSATRAIARFCDFIRGEGIIPT